MSPLVKRLLTRPSDRSLNPPPAPTRGPRARTYRRLLAQAMALVRLGRIPSLPEVAAKARVSRATAYRYFPSRSALVSAVVAEALAPVRRFEPKPADGLGRVRELFDKTFPLFKQFEPHMRAALQLALEDESLERLGRLAEEPFRRGHRRYMLHRAAAPLQSTLGPPVYDRLLKALSLIYGIESYVVLRDIWGASYRDVEAVARWMLDALIESSLSQASRASRADPRPRRAHRSGMPRAAQRSPPSRTTTTRPSGPANSKISSDAAIAPRGHLEDALRADGRRVPSPPSRAVPRRGRVSLWAGQLGRRTFCCAEDSRVYLDRSFFEDLARRLGAGGVSRAPT